MPLLFCSRFAPWASLRLRVKRGLACFAVILAALTAPISAAERIPSLADVVAAKTDVWGELAMREANGASYEFFEGLLPPPRYVHADFRHYPLVLSAPGAKTKARLISNGSGVNLRGGSRSWNEVGTPVVFRVGPDEFRFGDLRERLSDPKLAEGWLPIYEITYRHPFPVQAEGLVPIDQKPVEREAEVYRLEAFVSTEARLAEQAVVFVRFSLAAGARGIVTVELDPAASGSFDQSEILDASNRPIVVLDANWKWERQGAHAQLRPGSAATLAIPTKAFQRGAMKVNESLYEQERARTMETWKEIVGRAMQVEVSEERVKNAWRNLLVQNFMLLSGENMFYSAGNQYERLYEAEGSDAALAMMAWGYEEEAKRMFGPLLDFTRPGLENHQAGFKLHDVARCYWQTRDREWVQETRRRWIRELQRIVMDRKREEGLLPKERYCGDIATPVHSLGVEAKAWRALHDMMPVLRAMGDEMGASLYGKEEVKLRTKLLDVVARSVRRETTPPFVPIALLDKEEAHTPITATRIGSYWNLIIQYVIGSRLFPPGSEEEAWIPKYLENHGGLCMGMVRSGGTAHGFWTGAERVNPLYGTRYVIDALRRDDPERALVSFYGMLAQGFTRNTLVAGEGCTLAPVDEGGRFFYCPPNSAGNAHFLTMLRNLLVQDFDLDDDGEPETVRLLFGTSRRWLEDGKQIVVERAPTAFGPVGVRMESRLAKGEVVASVELPSRNPPKRALMRARVPAGWRVSGVTIDGKVAAVDERGTVELSGQKGKVGVRFAVVKE